MNTPETDQNERPTPETDKEWRHPASFDGSERVVHISVAQKRERERDEAREKYFAMRDLSNNATELAEKYKRERDEAREQWKQQNEALITLALHGDAEIQRLTKERDDARARVELIKPHKNNPVAEYFSSNTPETDAAVISSNGQWSFVRNLLKQRLARERNELMKALEAAK
jgi:hypothetical protein